MAAFTRGNKTTSARPVDVPVSWFRKIMLSRRSSERVIERLLLERILLRGICRVMKWPGRPSISC